MTAKRIRQTWMQLASAACIVVLGVSAVQVSGIRTPGRESGSSSQPGGLLSSLGNLFRGGADSSGPAEGRNESAKPAWQDRVLEGESQAEPVFESSVAAEYFDSPDGVAVHPGDGRIFISEENAGRIVVWEQGAVRTVIDEHSPIYRADGPDRAMGPPLRFPEGIAFDEQGGLYVVEDRPGGRVVYFAGRPDGGFEAGREVDVPGLWDRMAWEDVASGPDGRLMIAGSDLESVDAGGGSALPSGVILYRDAEGSWWIPYQRLFAGFSSVDFSLDGRRAVYTCELTGETGWFELYSSRGLGGQARLNAESPEGICALPDGSLLVAEERGVVSRIDPAVNRSTVIYEGEHTIESLTWDAGRGCVWMTEDGGGSLVRLQPDIRITDERDRLDYAAYHPMYGPQHVPSTCPGYLARVLGLGGVHYNAVDARTPVSFREFVSRIPLIAADAEVDLIERSGAVRDPIRRVQFVVFHPGTLRVDEEGIHTALAAFATKRESGTMTRTSLKEMEAHAGPMPLGVLDSYGSTRMVVPVPASISVSPLGIATVTFLGLGETPDYSLVLNPRNPHDSYMVVMDGDQRAQYRLRFPDAEQQRDQWVIAYSDVRHDGWERLSGHVGGAEVQTARLHPPDGSQ